MKKYILAFSAFVIFIMFFAFIISKGNDDGTATEEFTEYSDHIDQQVPVDTLETLIDSSSEIALVNEDMAESQSSLPQNLSNYPEQIIKRIAYTVSYNNSTKCPNWVYWCLTKDHTDGPYSRKGMPYYEDDGTVAGIGVVSDENFRYGYFLDTDVKGPRQEFHDWADKSYHVNHGHICPAGDNRWSKAAMNQSFYLTNMCPQDIDLNGGDWEGLERRCRGWAKRYGEIHIVAGPIFYTKEYRTMGEGKVGVPDAFFKVILRNGRESKGIAFIFPNEGTHRDLVQYVKTIDEVESSTGFDFFTQLPDEIENEIESVSDLNEW
jgi:endonuclease G